MDRFGFIHSLFIFCLLRSWLFSTTDVHNFIWLLAKFRRRELKDIESKEFQNRNSLLHLNKEFASIYFIILLQCSDFHLNLPRGIQIYILLQLKIEFTWKVIAAKRTVIKPPSSSFFYVQRQKVGIFLNRTSKRFVAVEGSVILFI